MGPSSLHHSGSLHCHCLFICQLHSTLCAPVGQSLCHGHLSPVTSMIPIIQVEYLINTCEISARWKAVTEVCERGLGEEEELSTLPVERRAWAYEGKEQLSILCVRNDKYLELLDRTLQGRGWQEMKLAPQAETLFSLTVNRVKRSSPLISISPWPGLEDRPLKLTVV